MRCCKRNGAAVEIREVAGLGRGGKTYEFLLESLPVELQKKYAKNQPKPEVKIEPETVVEKVVPNTQSIWSGYDVKPQKAKEDASEKLKVLNELEAWLAEGKGSFRDFAREKKLAHSTLYRWKERVKNAPKSDWLPLLIDEYTAGSTSAEFSPEAWEFCKALYLNRAQKSASVTYEYTLIAAREHGWSVPSYRTVLRRLREIKSDVVRALREGEEAVKEMMPKIRRHTRDLHAMKLIVGDGLDPKLTFGVVFTNDGEIINHPKIWFWQDVYSGMILGFKLAKSENRDMIRTSLGEVIEKYGIPDAVQIDNTRAAANKELSGGISHRFRYKFKEEEADGILKMLGIGVHWATPGQGWVKPIERKNRDANDLIPAHPIVLNAYAEKRPVQDVELIQVIEECVNIVNERVSRSSICAGIRSPQQVFVESYQQQTLITRLTVEQRRLFLLAAEGVQVRKDGYIILYENLYWHQTLADYRGQKVTVRFDADHLQKPLAVYTFDGRFICDADYHPSMGYLDREGARNAKRLQKNYRDQLKKTSKAEVAMDAALAAKLMPTPTQTPIHCLHSTYKIPSR